MGAAIFDVEEYFGAYISVLRGIAAAQVERLAQIVFDAWRGNHTVFICGNGGNAANSIHIAADLVKLTAPPNGPRLRAVALGETIAGLTAIANDIAYEQVFAEQLRAFLAPNDVVLGLSTSGSSPNVLRAVEYANEVGAITAGITGLGGDKLRACARYPIVVESASVQQIEDATMVIGHLVCLSVRQRVLATTVATPHPVPAVATLRHELPLAVAAPSTRPRVVAHAEV